MQDRSQLIQRGASDAVLSPQFGLRQGGKVAERLEPIVKKEAEGFGLQVQFVDAGIGRNRCAVVLCHAGSSRCPLGTALVARILPARETPRCHAPDDRALAPPEIQNENVAVLVSIQPSQRMQPIELGSVWAEHLICELSTDSSI